MKTVADHAVLRSLADRLGAVTPESRRRWGTLTAHEMLCHLGDAAEMALRVRPRDKPLQVRERPIVKWLALWTPLRFPHGVPTSRFLDPRAGGTPPGEFARDRHRALDALRAIAAARPGSLEPAHGIFGTMSLADWHRWAYKHTDHHLRQFGL
jgi:hypothetical protein